MSPTDRGSQSRQGMSNFQLSSENQGQVKAHSSYLLSSSYSLDSLGEDDDRQDTLLVLFTPYTFHDSLDSAFSPIVDATHFRKKTSEKQRANVTYFLIDRIWS